MALDLSNPKHAHVDARLRSEPIIWLSSVRSDGRPHLVPIWFLWDGTELIFFSQPGKQKVRNIEHQPIVMLALEAIDDGEDVVLFEGRATLLDDPTISPQLPEYVAKYARLMELIHTTPPQMAADYSQVVRVMPTKWLFW